MSESSHVENHIYIEIIGINLRFLFFIAAHIQTTLELPDLDLSGALRETTSRVENMMSTARNGSTQNQVSPSSRASSSSNVSVSSEVMQRSHTTLH